MVAIRLIGFTGEQPQLIPRLLPDTGAQSAISVRLNDGGLTPMRAAKQKATLESANFKTIYRHNGAWLGWENVVHAAPGPIADDRLYWTGDDEPKVMIDDEVYSLAVPRPSIVPVATPSGSGSGNAVSRTYVYTWVTAFGEESEPSAATEPIAWQPGQTVTISNIDTVPINGFLKKKRIKEYELLWTDGDGNQWGWLWTDGASNQFIGTGGIQEQAPNDRGITKQRFYRSQTGASGTYFYLIAERDVSTADFVDDIPVDEFAEPLASASYNAPPDDLAGLTAMANGMMAGYRDKEVCFCEPYLPHAWPEVYRLTVDAPIVALGAIGTALIVMTEANPYLVVGSTPDAMQMVKLEANFPCINGRAVVDLGFAIAYPSNEGLVTVRPDGGIAIVTGKLFDRDKWLDLKPDEMLASQMGGHYAAFVEETDEGGNVTNTVLMIDLAQAPYLVRAQAAASAVYFDTRDSGLYFLDKDERRVLRLDDPSGQREKFYWKSKPYYLPSPGNFGAIDIDAQDAISRTEQLNWQAEVDAVKAANASLFNGGGLLGPMNERPLNTLPLNGDITQPLPSPLAGTLNIGIYADDKRVATLNSAGAQRLPSGFRGRKWEIDVSADVQVEEIRMASTFDELKRIPI